MMDVIFDPRVSVINQIQLWISIIELWRITKIELCIAIIKIWYPWYLEFNYDMDINFRIVHIHDIIYGNHKFHWWFQNNMDSHNSIMISVNELCISIIDLWISVIKHMKLCISIIELWKIIMIKLWISMIKNMDIHQWILYLYIHDKIMNVHNSINNGLV